MTRINLRDYYPDHYSEDTYVDVPEDIVEYLQASDRAERAYERRRYYNKAHYSLDRGDGIECDAVFLAISPWEVYERKLNAQELHAAISSLPDKQAKRLMAHFFLGMSMTEIGIAEGVNESQISRSVNKALGALKKYFKKF